MLPPAEKSRGYMVQAFPCHKLHPLLQWCPEPLNSCVLIAILQLIKFQTSVFMSNVNTQTWCRQESFPVPDAPSQVPAGISFRTTYSTLGTLIGDVKFVPKHLKESANIWITFPFISVEYQFLTTRKMAPSMKQPKRMFLLLACTKPLLKLHV